MTRGVIGSTNTKRCNTIVRSISVKNDVTGGVQMWNGMAITAGVTTNFEVISLRLEIPSSELVDGFNISGTAIIDWFETPPVNSDASFQIIVGSGSLLNPCQQEMSDCTASNETVGNGLGRPAFIFSYNNNSSSGAVTYMDTTSANLMSISTFEYSGSDYYGSNPVWFSAVVSWDYNTPQGYSYIRLYDITGYRDDIQSNPWLPVAINNPAQPGLLIAEMLLDPATQSPGNDVPIIVKTSNFYNLPTGPRIFTIKMATSVSNTKFRVHSVQISL